MTADRDRRSDWVLALARRLIGLFSLFVPGPRRDDWRREWAAEIAHASRRLGDDPRSTHRLLRRSLLSAPDAVLLRIRGVGMSEPSPHGLGRHARRGWIQATFEDLLRDLRVSARSLAKQRGFATIAVLTIGLGIGAATTIFTLVNGVLLKPLAYPEPDRLVSVWPAAWYSGALFDLLERESDSYEALAAWGPRSYTEIDEAGAQRVWGSRATGDFLRVLGTAPTAGRGFATAEDEPGSPGGVVLSHAFWESRFGSDPSIVGQRLRIVHAELGDDGVPIVGIMPRGFPFQPGYFGEAREPADFALTVPFDREATRYQSSEYKVIGRLRPDVTRRQAEEELRSLVGAWIEQYGLPDDFGADVAVIPLKEHVVGEARPTIILLFGAVGLILLIATANVANLLLAKSLSDQKEIAMRLALGATRWRIARKLLTESTLLAGVGSAFGFVIAIAGVNGVRALLPSNTPRLEAVELDAIVLGFCALLALLTGWAIGVLPAIQSGRADVRSALGGDARGVTGGRGKRRVQTGLLAAEIGLAVVLLASTGLLTKSFWQLNQLDPGFRPDGLVKLNVRPSPGRAPTFEQQEEYFRLIDERLEAIPGVASAAGITQAPVSGDGGVVGYSRVDQPPAEGETSTRVRWRAVTSDYFETAAIPLVAGRGFTTADADGAEPVGILSRQAVEELFPGQDPMGGRIVTGFERQPVTIIGVAGDIRVLGPAEPSLSMVYRPYRQIRTVVERFGFTSREFVLRTVLPPGGLGALARSAVLEIDSQALVSGVETIPDAIAATLSERRTTLILLSLFATGAVLLGGIGIYGVTGYIVGDRRKELGVRVAVGASAGRIISEVLGGVLKVAAVGAGLGTAGALALSGVLRSFIVEIDAIDPWTLTLAVMAALTLALLAGLLPARDAGRTDPIEVLTADG